MIRSRTQNSIRNMLAAFLMQAVSVLAAFACRTVFARLLAEEYLGISGLFSNIISILALSELGIGNVIIIQLYKPLAENDEDRICRLMHFYKRAYTLIGFFVLACGAILTPFLPYLIKSDTEIPLLPLYFLLFVVQSAASYFFAYKRSILIASQQEYICTLITQLFDLVLKAGQIAVLLITHQYIAYLAVGIVTGLGSNIVIALIADRRFPYLKRRSEGLEKAEVKSMMNNVSSMMIHKVGNTIVTSTDNILISSMIGIAVTGRYSNYVLIMNMVMQIISIIFGSISASLGDYNAQKSLKERKQMFDTLCFVTQWIFGFGLVGFICLYQPTISVWLGSNFLLEFSIVLVISLNFYLNGIFRIPATFIDLNGLYIKTRWKPAAMAIINLVVSVILGKRMGLIGIFIGTSASYLMVPAWVDAYYLFKNVWKTGAKDFVWRQVQALLITAAVCFATFYAVSAAPSYLLKALICIVLPNLCFFAVYSRRDEFRFLLMRFKGFASSKACK